MSCLSFNRHIPHSHGVFLPVLAIVVSGVLAITGLVVDTLHLQREQQRLQTAADAAATAAAYRFNSENANTLTNQIVPQLVADNLQPLGINPADVTVDASLDDTNFPTEITVTASASIDTYLLDLLKFAGTSTEVSVVAKARKIKLIVSLLLDASDSFCQGGCNCVLGPHDGCPKIMGMKNGASAFVEELGDDSWLGMVRFSASGYPPNGNDAAEFFSIQQMNTTNRSAALTAVEDFYYTGGTGTNIASALSVARNQIQSATMSPNDEKIIILFTDGMPSYTSSMAWPPSCDTSRPIHQKGFLASIVEADLARQEDITVYTIGVGTPTDFSDGNWSQNPADITWHANGFEASLPCRMPSIALALSQPFQEYQVSSGMPYMGYICALSNFHKEFFMARLANDQPYMNANEVANTHPDAPEDVPPQPDFPCVNTNGSQASLPQGEFLFASDPVLLPGLFQQLAVRVVRLTE